MVAFVCQAPSASCALDMYRTESTNISEKNKDSNQIKNIVYYILSVLSIISIHLKVNPYTVSISLTMCIHSLDLTEDPADKEPLKNTGLLIYRNPETDN